jgi:hypothetical protein
MPDEKRIFQHRYAINSDMNTSYVTASELADYIYCECCWADKLEGPRQETEEMLAGTQKHVLFQWQYTLIEFVRQVSLIIVIGSVVLLLIVAIILFLSGR